MRDLAEPKRLDPEKYAEKLDLHQREKVLRKVARVANDYGAIVPDKLEQAKTTNI